MTTYTDQKLKETVKGIKEEIKKNRHGQKVSFSGWAINLSNNHAENCLTVCYWVGDRQYDYNMAI